MRRRWVAQRYQRVILEVKLPPLSARGDILFIKSFRINFSQLTFPLHSRHRSVCVCVWKRGPGKRFTFDFFHDAAGKRKEWRVLKLLISCCSRHLSPSSPNQLFSSARRIPACLFSQQQRQSALTCLDLKRIHVALPGCHGNSRRSIKAASPDKTSAQRPPALMSSYILASLWRELRDWCLGPPTWHMIEENCWKQKPTTNVGLNCGENAQNCFRVPFFWWGGMRASVRVETEVWQRAGWVIGLLKVTVLHANTRTHEYTHVHWHTTNWPEERRCFQKINIWKLFLDQTKSSSPMFASTLFFVCSHWLASTD